MTAPDERPAGRGARTQAHQGRHHRRRRAKCGASPSKTTVRNRASIARSRCCAASQPRSVRRAALPENGSFIAREAAGVRSSPCGDRMERSAPSATPAATAACASPRHTLHERLHVPLPRLDLRPRWRAAPRPARTRLSRVSTNQRTALVPLKAEERAGLVFITQEGEANPLGDLPDLIAKDQALYATTERDVDANWKIFLEGFLEGYHIRATHPETFLPYGFDNLTLLETFGRNSRITFPFKRIKKLTDVPEAERKVGGLVTIRLSPVPERLVTHPPRATRTS